MRLEQLEYLVEISRATSMNKASRSLNVSVQALSMSVSSLEDELETRLFVRSSTGVKLTKAGERVCKFAELTLCEYRKLREELRGKGIPNSPRAVGSIFVFANPLFFESGLMSKVARFNEIHPEIRVNLIQADVKDVLSGVSGHRNGAVSAGLGMVVLPGTTEAEHRAFMGEESRGLNILPISENRYVCAVAAGSNLANCGRISMKTITREPLVVFSSIGGSYNSALYLLKKYGEPKIAATVGSIVAWHQAVNEGMGIGLLNTAFLNGGSPVESLFEDLRLLPIREPTENISAFIYKANKNQMAASFVSYIGNLGEPQTA